MAFAGAPRRDGSLLDDLGDEPLAALFGGGAGCGLSGARSVDLNAYARRDWPAAGLGDTSHVNRHARRRMVACCVHAGGTVFAASRAEPAAVVVGNQLPDASLCAIDPDCALRSIRRASRRSADPGLNVRI
ncbi:MAG: hypothetical protein MZV65_49310 [Chromatiales bacterium]|nr:hypothetical protein [Chromatiales bacterium]